jgi:DNA-binding LytR/AlgR family response regulator
MIRCIIIDDEPLALEVLEAHISHCPQLTLVRKCRNALEAYEVLQTEKIDLMFLDIRMPSISGIELIRSLRHPPAVIFTTAFAEYAITGFELDAVDYLLKPVTFQRFEKSIHKLLKILPPEPEEVRNYTYFKVSGRLLKVLHEDLLFAQSIKDYIRLKTRQGAYLTHMTMKYLQELLPAGTFIRVHRSWLVNKASITAIDRMQLEIDQEKIPIGAKYRLGISISLHGPSQMTP